MRATRGTVKVIPSNFYATTPGRQLSPMRTPGVSLSRFEQCGRPPEIDATRCLASASGFGTRLALGQAVPIAIEDIMHRHRSWLILALLALLPGTLPAQQIVADISLGHGPITGRVIVGDPYPHYHHSVIVVRPGYPYRPVYRAVVVRERYRGHGWYRHHGYRTVRIWYDADRRAYYDRYDRDYPGLREVIVYERDGRYYRDGRPDAYDRDDRHDGDDRYDRDDRHGRNGRLRSVSER